MVRMLPVLLCFLCAHALELKDVFPGMRFEKPVFLLEDPGERGRFYVVEQSGVVRTFRKGDRRSSVFVDIRDRVRSGGEMGLLGMAFHPDFPHNGVFYLSYTDKGMHSVVSEFRGGRERVLLRVKQPYANHNGGHIAFGPDGYLYIGFGDGGSAGDPLNHGQNRNTLLGAILRIDVNGDPYAVPEDNPFAKGGGRPEIYAWGFRNPWRWSFDKETGDLWAGDVGQDRWEEIDVVEKGRNYGWRCYEGFAPYRLKSCGPRKSYTFPVHVYPLREGNCSVIGGYVYRGKRIRSLYGWYIFGDFCSGRIWALKRENGRVSVKLLLDTDLRISSFAEDGEGEIYVIDYAGGKIYMLSP